MINGTHIAAARRIEGLDEYYFSRKLAEVRALHTAAHPVINLGIGNPDLPPPPEVIEALMASAQNPLHHGYQPYTGVPALRSAISGFTERFFGIRPDADSMILPLIGSKEGIVHISLAFLNEGDEVLVPDPGYPTYAAAAALAGATVTTYSINYDGSVINIDELYNRDLSRVKLMWINFPHMPTGRTCDRQLMRDLVTLARRKNILLVNDNAYALIRNQSPVSLLSVPGAEAIALELNSLSKSHNMAGWRLGWVTGRKEFIQHILRVKSNMDSGMFLPVQHAAATALQLNESWFAHLNKIYAQRAEKVYRLLDSLNCCYNTDRAGLFVWARLPEGLNDTVFIDEVLYGARIFITPGSVFGRNGQGFVRVSLCVPSEKIEEATQRIDEWKLKSGKIPSVIETKFQQT
jgi:aspartate/methionine/tyrosine aminotransferase